MSSTGKILVTGVTSGLGKYIYENIPDCVGMTRENRHYVLKDEYDLIIHCAFSSERGNDITDYFEYIDSNILLTNELVNTKHKKFVYISSVVVYDEGYSNYKSTKFYIGYSSLRTTDTIYSISLKSGRKKLLKQICFFIRALC